MAHSRARVAAAVRARFPRSDPELILALLDESGVEAYQRERDRVQLAVVALSGGDEAKLRYFLEVAKRDYRDVLFWSDNPEEAKIDTPEKRKRVREMFVKIGLKPPPGAPYLRVFQLVGVTAFMGYALALWQLSIWYRRDWMTTIKSNVDGLIYGLLTAGTFGWLWPH